MTTAFLTKSRLFSHSRVIALLAFLLQLFVAIRFSHSAEFLPDGSDMQFYSDWAKRIAGGLWSDGRAFYGLPGYAYLLALFYSLLGFDPFTVAVFQAVVFAAVAVMIYQLALLSFGGSDHSPTDKHASAEAKWIGWLAALTWIFYVPAQTFATILMPSIWGVAGYWGCLLWILRVRKPGRVVQWFVIGVAIGLLATAVATVFILLPILVAAIWRLAPATSGETARFPRFAIAVVGAAAGIALGTAPAWLHNRLIAHEPVFLSAHGGINFWIGNNPTANGYPKMPPGIRSSQEGSMYDSIALAESTAGRRLTRAEVSKFWSQKANSYIAGNFGDWINLLGRKLMNFWNAYEYDDVSTIGRLREEGVATPGFHYGLVAALGLSGMVCAGWRRGGPRWICAAVLLHLVALLPVFVTERYRLVAVPGLALFAGWLIVSAWRHLMERRFRPPLAFAGVALVAAWFCSIPQRDFSLWSLDHYDAGLRALKLGQLDKAEDRLKKALAYAPGSAEIHFALGNLWLERGNRNEAKRLYRSALNLNPKHDGVLNNLGVLALEEKRWDLAEQFFLGSLETEPRDPKTHFLLARARLERGDRTGALQAAQRAVQLAPRQPEFVALLQMLQQAP